jgi:hypothetical protein
MLGDNYSFEDLLDFQADQSPACLKLTTIIQSEQDAKCVASWISEHHPESIRLEGCGVTNNILQKLVLSIRKDSRLKFLSLLNNEIDYQACGTLSDTLRLNTAIDSINLLGNRLCPTEVKLITNHESPIGGDPLKNSRSSAQESPFDEEDQVSLLEFVITCNEMQNLRSVCGCKYNHNEVIISTVTPSKECASDILLLGIDLKLSTDLLSLQLTGSMGLCEIFEALKDNQAVIRATFGSFYNPDRDFDLALLMFLERNTQLLTLQFCFTHDDNETASKTTVDAANAETLSTVKLATRSTTLALQHHTKSVSAWSPAKQQQRQRLQRSNESDRNIMLCILSAMAKNDGITTLQMDEWPRSHEIIVSMAAMLRSNAHLLHLGLFGTAMKPEDLVTIAGGLEYNTALRVLFLSESCAAAAATAATTSAAAATPTVGMAVNGATSESLQQQQRNNGESHGSNTQPENLKDPPCLVEAYLLTPRVQQRLREVASLRKIPFIIRLVHHALAVCEFLHIFDFTT